MSHSCDDPAVTHLPRFTRTPVPTHAPSREIDAAVRGCLGRGESLYTIDVETLDPLQPDRIITQGLCEVCAVTEREVEGALRTMRVAPRVLSSEPRTVLQVLESITEIGRALGREAAGAELVAGLRRRIDAVRARTRPVPQRRRVALLEWLDPPMCGGHWNPELVEMAGGVDGLGRARAPHNPVGRRRGMAARGALRGVLRLPGGTDAA